MSLDKWMRVNEKFSKCNLKNFVGESTFDVDVTNKKKHIPCLTRLEWFELCARAHSRFWIFSPCNYVFIKSLCKGTENMNLFSLKVFIKLKISLFQPSDRRARARKIKNCALFRVSECLEQGALKQQWFSQFSVFLCLIFGELSYTVWRHKFVIASPQPPWVTSLQEFKIVN